jgi:hypothetical protein
VAPARNTEPTDEPATIAATAIPALVDDPVEPLRILVGKVLGVGRRRARRPPRRLRTRFLAFEWPTAVDTDNTAAAKHER